MSRYTIDLSGHTESMLFNYMKKNGIKLKSVGIKKCIEDIIMQIAYENYIKDYKKIKTTKKHKANIIKNVIAKKTYKGKILNALDRLGYEQEKAAEKFYEMFDEENSKVY